MEGSNNMKLTARFRREGDWIAAWFIEMPGVVSQGRTIEMARVNLLDALRTIEVYNRMDAR